MLKSNITLILGLGDNKVSRDIWNLKNNGICFITIIKTAAAHVLISECDEGCLARRDGQIDLNDFILN